MIKFWNLVVEVQQSFFAQRVKQIISIERDPVWFAEVAVRLKELELENAGMLLIRAEGVPYQEVRLLQLFIETLSTEEFDWVLVDGDFRILCLEKTPRVVKKGGYLILDNYALPSYQEVVKRIFPEWIQEKYNVDGWLDKGMAFYRKPME